MKKNKRNQHNAFASVVTAFTIGLVCVFFIQSSMYIMNEVPLLDAFETLLGKEIN